MDDDIYLPPVSVSGRSVIDDLRAASEEFRAARLDPDEVAETMRQLADALIAGFAPRRAGPRTEPIPHPDPVVRPRARKRRRRR